MLIAGILLALLSAAIQSISFLASRRFIVQGHGGGIRLLAMGNLIMGIAAGCLLPIWWHPVLLDWQRWLLDACGASGLYLVGQIGFMLALRHSESSRVAPLLALKVPAVAVVTIVILGSHVTPPQWTAVAISVAAAFVLNRVGGSLPAKTICGLLFAVSLFAISDAFIKRLFVACSDPALPGGATGYQAFAAAARAVCVSYVICGMISAVALCWVGTTDRKAWKAVLPYAGAWFTSMFFFYAAVGFVGPVLANIAISTRGLWAIGLGVLIAHRGQHHLEQHVERGVLIRRTLAAAMMTAAIALYGWADRLMAWLPS